MFSGLMPNQSMAEVKKLPLQKLEIEGWPSGVSFQPHGIYIDREHDLLYAINHALHMGGERIEVLGIETDDDDIPTHLDYQYSITQEELNEEAYGVLNSIVAVDLNKFYVTRFKPYALPPYGTPIKGKWNSILRTVLNPSTYVLYCEYAMPSQEFTSELNCRKVADGFMVANGLTTN